MIQPALMTYSVPQMTMNEQQQFVEVTAVVAVDVVDAAVAERREVVDR